MHRGLIKIEGGDQRGGVMLLVLVLLIVFIVMMSATLRYVIRQSHETVDQEQEEQAFNAADAGISYALWLLNPNLHDPDINPFDIRQMAQNPHDTVVTNHPVQDDNGMLIGTFTFDDLNSVQPGHNYMNFRSIGQDAVLTDRCQAIRATLREVVSGEPYVVVSWDHQVGYPCP